MHVSMLLLSSSNCPVPTVPPHHCVTIIITCFMVFILRFTLQTHRSHGSKHFLSRVFETEPHFHFSIMRAFLNFE